MIDHIISLMLNDIDVAIVTAAAYPGDTEMFEGRLAGLLDAFRERRLPAEVTNRWVWTSLPHCEGDCVGAGCPAGVVRTAHSRHSARFKLKHSPLLAALQPPISCTSHNMNGRAECHTQQPPCPSMLATACL